MAQFVVNRDLSDIICTEIDKYVIYVTGSTPSSLSAALPDRLSRLQPDHVDKFTSACLVAATTQRRVLNDYLSQPGFETVSQFIRNEFFLNEQVNFTALNLIGHCLMASRMTLDNNPRVTAFRAKARGRSIWHANLAASRFSDAQKRIYREKVERFSLNEAKEHGDAMANALIACGGTSAMQET